MDPIALFRERIAAQVRLDRELTGGGMARVFVGQDLRLDREVVLKVLPPERAAAIDRTRFSREIAVIARLQHPNVVPILWNGEEAGLPYFVMPFVAGRSLRARLQDGPIPAGQAVPILRDVVRALAVAHRAGIVHRDIKPDNVLLAPDGAAMVSDFGIAKLVSAAKLDGANAAHETGQATLAGTSLGTPAYMAPEQAAGDPDADHRIDIYSFGVVAYEMLAGRPLFGDRRPQALLAAHIAELPEPLHRVAPDVPEALSRLVMRCLEKSPDARFASADEVLVVLETATPSGSVTLPSQRRPRALRRAGIAAIALALLGGGGFLLAQRLRAAPLDPQLIAVAPFRVVLPDSALGFLRDGMPDLLSAASLTGEGGPRAIESRTTLAAFHDAAKDGDPSALPLERALGIARGLGAGRLLQGEVLPTASGVAMSVTLYDSKTGAPSPKFRVEGARDSIPMLVERLGAQLLTSLSGEATVRSQRVGQVPLPALRAYLQGRGLLRRMQSAEATAEFHRALDLDSTFALAGVSMALASGWNGDAASRSRGLTVARDHRDQLSPKDQAMLDALQGPSFPTPPTAPERLTSAEAYVAVAPDRADAWYLLGDVHFHYGAALGEADWIHRSYAAFQRALVVDSTYRPGYAHLVELATLVRDQPLRDRLARLSDSAAPLQRWFAGRIDGDSQAVAAAWPAAAPGTGFYNSVLDYVAFSGIGTEDVLRAADRVVADAATPKGIAQGHAIAHWAALNLGRLDAAATHLAASTTGADSTREFAQRVYDAIATGTDVPGSEAAIKRLQTVAADRKAPRQNVRIAARALILSAVDLGDAAMIARYLRVLRGVEAPASGDTLIVRDPTAELAAAWLGQGRGPRGAKALIALDNALQEVRWDLIDRAAVSIEALLSARLFAATGDYARAAKAARRRTVRLGSINWYIVPQLLAEGRYAAAAGDTTASRYALTQYLRWRQAPDTALRAEARAAKQLVDSLGGTLEPWQLAH